MSSMSFLSMMEARLPPGFRFHPRDEELVCDYLAKKVSVDGGNDSFYGFPTIIDVDLNKCEPWDLPEMACVGGKEWYFFSLRDRKYATGQRTNRATQSGYWKATGKDRHVSRRGVLVGMRKTLVFYQGRAPKGRKTEWVMHEFRMEGPYGPPQFSFKEDWVLCRVFCKSRGVASKPIAETSYEDTGSSSLPPLMDSYIKFDQAPPSLEGYEQVSCFSNLPPSPASHCPNDTFPIIPLVERSLPTKNVSAHMGGLPTDMASCDKKAIRAVLNHLTKLESSPKREVHPNLYQGGLESFFAENGLSHIWNTLC